jgi:translation initiation factor IF-3
LIDQNGEQVGIVATSEALSMARKVSLDLVEIVPNQRPPVCRIMDYGKHAFEISKRKSANKKKQRQTQVKEVKFRPVTDVGDYNVKLNKIVKFLERGDKVKISMRFRGREMMHRELGMKVLGRIKNDLPDNLIVEQEPKLEGRQLTMIVVQGKAK